MTREELDKALRAMLESMTCLETRDHHPPCDYCGEVFGAHEREVIQAIQAELADLRARLDGAEIFKKQAANTGVCACCGAKIAEREQC